MNCEKRWKDMTKRIGWIDNLKGVAILLVVIRHVMQANITDCSQTIIGNAIFAVQMPLFMIIAGYFSITSDKYYSSKTEIWNYIKKRLMHYILPFFSWYIVVYVLLRGFYNRNVFEALKILVNNVDVGLWFLYVVFVLSVVMVIAKAICTRLKFPSKTGILPILTGGILLPLLPLGRIYGMRFLGINLLLYYYLFFALGFFLFCNKNLITRAFTSQKTAGALGVIAGVIFVGIICVHNIELAPDGVINICLRIIAAISGCTAIAVMVYLLSQNKRNKWLSIIGQNTLEVYVVHVHYIGLLPKGVHYLYSIDGLLIFFAALGVTAVLTTITIFVIKRVPVLYVMLFGKR